MMGGQHMQHMMQGGPKQQPMPQAHQGMVQQPMPMQ
jgi:hypothetical protein